MFWILRRTEAFLNSFNNNPSKNITRNYERRNSGEFFIYDGTKSLNYSDGNVKEISFLMKKILQNQYLRGFLKGIFTEYLKKFTSEQNQKFIL